MILGVEHEGAWKDEGSRSLLDSKVRDHGYGSVVLRLPKLFEHLVLVVVLRLLALFKECAYFSQLLEDNRPQIKSHLVIERCLDLNGGPFVR